MDFVRLNVLYHEIKMKGICFFCFYKHHIRRKMEDKLKYLEMIQEIIKRMASNSFLLKGWSVTFASAIIVLLDQTMKQEYFIFLYIPVIAFWFLDSYYLQLERKYKALYDIARKENNEIDFCLNIENIIYNSNDLNH